MGENLIPRRQLRSKRDQYRRKLAIDTKNTLFLMSPAKTRLEKKKNCKLMTKPRRYGGKSHPATPTQEQTRPISTETSNLFLCLLQKRALKKKCCKLMTKPHRYGGKSHPATPTQEQTRPISTETSNRYKKYAVFDVSCKNATWKKKICKLMTKPRRYGGKSHPATPTQEQTRPISTETSNLFWCLLQKRALKKKMLQADDQTA